MRKKAVITYIDEDNYRKLLKLAEKKGASVAQVIREIVLQYLDQGDKNGAS